MVTGDGKIAYRHVGPLTESAIKDKILPLLQPPSSQAARLIGYLRMAVTIRLSVSRNSCRLAGGRFASSF